MAWFIAVVTKIPELIMSIIKGLRWSIITDASWILSRILHRDSFLDRSFISLGILFTLNTVSCQLFRDIWIFIYSLFGSSPFWTPTCSPEVIRPRYGCASFYTYPLNAALKGIPFSMFFYSWSNFFNVIAAIYWKDI